MDGQLARLKELLGRSGRLEDEAGEELEAMVQYLQVPVGQQWVLGLVEAVLLRVELEKMVAAVLLQAELEEVVVEVLFVVLLMAPGVERADYLEKFKFELFSKFN